MDKFGGDLETYYIVEELPLALECGQSVDEFWNGNPNLLFAYYKAYVNRIHKHSHIQGMYNFIAFSYSMANAFKKKTDKPVEYPKEDIFNPFNEKNTKKGKSYISSIDTSENNNGLYNIKQRLSRRKGEK